MMIRHLLIVGFALASLIASAAVAQNRGGVVDDGVNAPLASTRRQGSPN